jgi:hypothetical protein
MISFRGVVVTSPPPIPGFAWRNDPFYFPTKNPGIAAQGFTEKWVGKAADGKWYSANYNPTKKTWSFGKLSSRNGSD